MVITQVEAECDADRTQDLLDAWRRVAGGPLPPGLERSYLMHSGTTWRIATFWESRGALEEMRRTTETPGALAVFAAAGAEPTVTIFEVQGYVGR